MLEQDKCDKITHLSQSVLDCSKPSILQVAQLIGIYVAAFPGVSHSQLQCRDIERDKNIALKQAKGNFQAPMTLSSQVHAEISW